MDQPITVVKLGGSLMRGGRLRSMLKSLIEPRIAGLVLVPGGGVFADAVRTAQTELRFDDALAHRLALDAMGHMAEILTALSPSLALARDVDGIARAHGCGRIPVWDPAGLRSGHANIPERWSVTSDSLALWLATELCADRLMLVKAAEPPAGGDPGTLAAAGFVDEAFPAFARVFSGEILVIGPSAAINLAAALRREPAPA